MKIVVLGEDVPMMHQAAADGGGMGELCNVFGEELVCGAHVLPVLDCMLVSWALELNGVHAGGAVILYADELEDE